MIPIGRVIKNLVMSDPQPAGIMRKIIVIKTPGMEKPEVQATVQPLDPEEIREKMLRLEKEAIERREQEIEDELGDEDDEIEDPEDEELEDKKVLVSGK